MRLWARLTSKERPRSFVVRSSSGRVVAERATLGDAERVAAFAVATHRALEIVDPDGRTVGRVEWTPPATAS